MLLLTHFNRIEIVSATQPQCNLIKLQACELKTEPSLLWHIKIPCYILFSRCHKLRCLCQQFICNIILKNLRQNKTLMFSSRIFFSCFFNFYLYIFETVFYLVWFFFFICRGDLTGTVVALFTTQKTCTTQRKPDQFAFLSLLQMVVSSSCYQQSRPQRQSENFLFAK